MAARSSMTSLIARLRALCNNDTALTDDDLQTMLDDHAILVDALLEPRVPFYTQHVAPFENLEDGAAVYYGYNTLLSEDADYTADYQRGVFTTPAADYRGLRILGQAYDLNAAAADAWERIASRVVLEFDFSDVEGDYKRSQQRDGCRAMAAQYRRRAWAVGHTVERADTPPLQSQNWRDEVIRRSRQGAAPV